MVPIYDYEEESATAPAEPDPTAQPRKRRRRRRGRAIAAALVLASAGGAAAVLLSDGGDGSDASANRTKLDAVPVTRADLVERQNVDGKLGYAGTYSVNAAAPGPDKETPPPNGGNRPQGGGTPPPSQGPGGGNPPQGSGSGGGAGTGGGSGQGGTPPDAGNNAGPGTITWLPGVGDTLSRGDRVYGRDGTKVPLFYGETPFWRALYVGVDKGADVRELEQNLQALGYGGFTVDEKFTDTTAAAVKKWQKDMGHRQTGRFDPGDAVVLPDSVRVGEVTAVLGAGSQGPLFKASGTGRRVTVNLPVNKQTLANKDAKVQVTLPGGRTATGTVTRVGTVAKEGEQSQGGAPQGQDKATIPVDIALDQPKDAGTLDGAPVTVGFTGKERKGVLTVPVNALLALAEGGYGIEALEPDGGTRLLKVELGMFANGRVEVTGDGVTEGLKVGVPKA
ncbi:peptidoglycan-binding protein [Embleya sp. NBC_00888]|uniref:peptidoglycan-binding protein n=1 Tax=Embleya sp. NBC_00888 TaxID=2975960 RepID=UPI003867D119|nr:peptidoglycan-binding protein [Embleya sp. NBC_00888]